MKAKKGTKKDMNMKKERRAITIRYILGTELFEFNLVNINKSFVLQEDHKKSYHEEDGHKKKHHDEGIAIYLSLKLMTNV
jgi:hypothetical protein